MGALPTEFSKLYDLGNSDGSFPGWFLGLFAKYLKLRIVEFGYLMHSWIVFNNFFHEPYERWRSCESGLPRNNEQDNNETIKTFRPSTG